MARTRMGGTSRGRRFAFALLTASIATMGGAKHAEGQQRTFHLDRLEMPGSPDDGVVLFRPVTQPGPPIFFAQLGIGYSLNPLRTSTITSDSYTIRNSSAGAIQHQLTQYTTVGFELLDRLILSATLPVTWWQQGNSPNYPPSSPIFGAQNTTSFRTSGPAVSDTRVDGRFIVWRSEDRKSAVAPQLSVFAPTGTTANFGGDGQVSALVGVSAETMVKFLVLTANTGIHFRPNNSINAPATGSGLGIGNEWRWAVGAFLPIKDGKYRLGGSIFGQTGLEDSTPDEPVPGNTRFTKRNTPIEWNVEARMKFGFGDSERWWAGAGAGSKILNGYGAPDFRIVAMIGTYLPLEDVNPKSPDRKAEIRRSIRESKSLDSDHDGIPDDIDACPNEPEDHKDPDPMDGCPAPSDRDGDGIPDNYDKCPDVPEDHDGIDDGDGCPEDDADKDGIPDVKDACPKVPGQPSPDPKKNGCPQFINLEGGSVRVLQQVKFAYNSSRILPDSFPMLQEIVQLLKANPGIKKMRIEGHTDSDGADDYNLKLSKDRAASVRVYLTTHGVEANRLESEGYGETKPIESNDNAAGKAANRRVEFKITEEEDANKMKKNE